MIENLKINWYVEVKKDNSKLTNALNNFNDRYNEILPMIKIQGRLSEQEAQLGYLVSVVHGDWSQLVAIH